MYGNGANSTIVDAKIYNVSSMREGYENLQILIPPNVIGKTFDREFDINYYNYIIQNDQVFMEFFRIIQDLYLNKNVYLMFGDDEWSENLCQSLLKIIQQRYGYNGYYIDNMNDYLYASMNDTSDFNKEYGIYNLDQDKMRYSYLVKQIQIRLPQDQYNMMELKYQ
jgi:hypothetical protein